MIDWLQIRHFAIASEVDIEFDSGFTTFTGETGAGKSIIVDAIRLLLGDRADNGLIQHGQDTAELQIGFALPKEHSAFAWLDSQNLENGDECILRRTIRRDKPSRAFVNGHAVTVSQLRELGKEVVDIHGQNEHHSLLSRQTQRVLLDTAADNVALVESLGVIYRDLNHIQVQIDRLSDESQSAQERADLLKFQIEELNELNPVEGEWLELEQNQKRAHHTSELTSGTQSISNKLYESDDQSLSSILVQCSQQLDQLSQYDPSLNGIVKMLEEANVNIEEAANQLRAFYEGMHIDEAEITRIEQRFSTYHQLSRKHRIQPEQLQSHFQQMKEELSDLKDPEAELARLNELKTLKIEAYQDLAIQISKNRKNTAAKLAGKVTKIMQQLGMQGGAFDIALHPVSSDTYTLYGNESIEFIVTANAGQPLAPLSKVASGGELSRISLAIQVILAEKAQIPTLVFDEVDVGIGGSIASVVGKKLQDLGKSTQVICITHLSQVAAKGNHHFHVTKKDGKTANTIVSKLDTQQRIEELARMSGGTELTPQSLSHAEEMLRSA